VSSTDSTSYVTAISQAITPAATDNKVLIHGNILVSIPYDDMQYDESQVDAQLYRGATAIGLVKTLWSSDGGMGAVETHLNLSWSYLDSPSTTSATTYYIKYKTFDPSSMGAPTINLLDAQITVQEVD
jgi:hypothetical protein